MTRQPPWKMNASKNAPAIPPGMRLPADIHSAVQKKTGHEPAVPA